MSNLPEQYAVFVDGKRAPTKFHANQDDALTEACRLIHEAQGRVARVMRVIYTCNITAEVTKHD